VEARELQRAVSDVHHRASGEQAGSPETCDSAAGMRPGNLRPLVRQAGYTFDAYERWLAETLVAVLLHRSEVPPVRSSTKAAPTPDEQPI
jgi:hypothetical protein